MTDKEKIKGRIEDWFNICLKRAKIVDADYWNAKADAYRNVLLAFDDLHEEPVSEDLEEFAGSIANFFTRGMSDDKIKEEMVSVIKNYVKIGANWQKEQMMKNSTERTVHIRYDLCPYIRRYELAFDIKTQVPDIKEGDKVKVIIIKED